MEIDAQVLSMIERTNSGDFAVYRVENGALHTLLSSPDLSALSGMTSEEYRAITEEDAAAIVLDSDRALVAATLAEVLGSDDGCTVFPLTYRVKHRPRGFVWLRAHARLIGESEGAPVVVVSFETLASASEEFSNLIDTVDMSIYVIDKDTYELLYANERALQFNGNRNYQNIACFQYFFGFEAPCNWCSLPLLEDGHAHVDENHVPPFDRWYRHDVFDIDWYGHEAAAFYISDITEQKRRQKLEEDRFSNFYRQIAAANPNAMAMFRLNLTKNTCSDAQSPYETARRQQSSGTVEGYLAACAEIITDADIKRDCLTRFTLPSLLREFQNGVTEMSIEYPIHSSSGDTIWIDGFITMTQNSVSGDIEGIAYAVNVTDQKINDSILERISEEKYDHIGLINPTTHSYELWKQDGAYELGSRQSVDYDKTFEDILDHYICQEDRDLFRDHGTLTNIVARLQEDGADSFVYRRLSETGGCLYKQVKYTWLDRQHDLIMEAQTDLTDLYERQLEQARRQHEAELAQERALSAESIPAGIGVFDVTEGEVCLDYLNDGFYQMLGVTREDYARYDGAGFIDAIYAEDRPTLLQGIMESLREDSQLKCRFRMLDGNGQWIWLELVANHVSLGAGTERFYASYYDVDELLRIQAELQEKELVFRDILTYSDILHFTYHPEHHRYDAEVIPTRLDGFPRAMDGYPDSFIRFIGLDENDARAYRDMVSAIDGGAAEAECTVLMHYGSKSGWYRVHMLSVPDENGHTLKAIGNVFNINRTVEAEKAIAEERLRMESLRGVYLATACFNVMKDAEISFNESGGLSRSADIDAVALAEAKEIEPDIERQRPETLSVLLSAAGQIPDKKQRHEFIRCCSHEGMLRLFQSGRRDVTLEYRRMLNDELIWMSTRIILMSEPSTGDLLAFYYTRDISDQKKTEQIAKLTLEKNCDYVALLNVAKRTIRFRNVSSRKSVEQDGWKVDVDNDYEVKRKTAISRFDLDKSDSRLAEQTTIENIVMNLGKSDEYSVTYDRNRPDGAVHRKQVRYRWLDETRTEILIVQTDITAAYVREQEHTRRLQDALDAAEQANLAQQMFLSNMSHDMRTPLNGVLGFTGLALAADDPERTREYLGKIDASGKLMLSLVNDILDLSKIDSGKMELHPETFDPHAELDAVVDPLRLDAEKRNISLTAEVDETYPRYILADRLRVEQILLNLIANAVKYTPDSGSIAVAVRVWREAGTAVIRSSPCAIRG